MKTALIIIGLQAALFGAIGMGFIAGRAFERLERLRQASSAFAGLASMIGSNDEVEKTLQSLLDSEQDPSA